MWFQRITFVVCIGLIVVYHIFPNLVDTIKVVRVDAVTVSLLAIGVIALSWNRLIVFGKNLRRTERRILLVVICGIIVIAGMLSPAMRIDTNAVWLIGIAAIVYFLPNLKSLMPYVKRIKIGDTEVELREEISSLEDVVDKAGSAVAQKEGASVSKDTARRRVTADVEKILEEAAKSPGAALLLLSAKLEEQLRLALEEADVDYSRVTSLTRLADLGVKREVFPPEILSAIREFSDVRNRVAHGAAFDIDDSYILSIISLGTQLLNIVSAIEPSSDTQYPNENSQQ